jgi:pimeloyl-ACP methyl ester carboxylesterase
VISSLACTTARTPAATSRRVMYSVLLAHPGVDRMTDIALSRRFFDRLAAPKRMVVLDGASHIPTEHPGVDQLEAAVVEFVNALAQA